jgi:hypothetical protein
MKAASRSQQVHDRIYGLQYSLYLHKDAPRWGCIIIAIKPTDSLRSSGAGKIRPPGPNKVHSHS